MAKRARKGEQHDYNADPANRRKKLVLTGARSVLDLTGARSYRAMRQQLPEAQPRTPEPVAARLGEHSHESEDQRVSEAGTAQQITQQVLALTQENRPHAPIVLPDPKELAHLRSDAPEIYALYVKAVDTQIEDRVVHQARSLRDTRQVHEARTVPRLRVGTSVARSRRIRDLHEPPANRRHHRSTQPRRTRSGVRSTRPRKQGRRVTRLILERPHSQKTAGPL